MIGKTVAVVLLLISALGTQCEVVPRSAVELRCLCVNFHLQFIQDKFIQNVNHIPSGPHCKNVEVIATLTDGREVCLKPTLRWVKRLIKIFLNKPNTNA